MFGVLAWVWQCGFMCTRGVMVIGGGWGVCFPPAFFVWLLGWGCVGFVCVVGVGGCDLFFV